MAAKLPIEPSAFGLESTLVTRLPMVQTYTGTRSMWRQEFRPNAHPAVFVSTRAVRDHVRGGSISL